MKHNELGIVLVCQLSRVPMGVSKLLSIEAELTDGVKDAVGTPVFTSFVFEDVSSFSDSELIVSRVTTTDELVTSEGFDGLDCVLDFHSWFCLYLYSKPFWSTCKLALCQFDNWLRLSAEN